MHCYNNNKNDTCAAVTWEIFQKEAKNKPEVAVVYKLECGNAGMPECSRIHSAIYPNFPKFIPNFLSSHFTCSSW